VCWLQWWPITGHFIMFSTIINIYNKKTKGPTLMELFTATGKPKKFFFWQLEKFDVCTTDDTAHIYVCMFHHCHMTSLYYWHESLQQWRISMHTCWCMCGRNLNIVLMCAVSPVVHTSHISSCKKNFFSFPVAVNNSVKVGPLVFLL
jgi:hypothetical protein